MQIRIDTDQARAVGRQFTTTGERLAEIGYELQRAIGSLDTWTWDGVSRQRAEPLLGQVRPNSERVAAELDELGRVLVRVAEAFEQEDNTAAQNLAGMPWVEFPLKAAVAGADYSIPPLDNMQDLFNALHDPNSAPVKIIQVGENEYVVLIKGTDTDEWQQANNWTGAIVSGMGMPGDYEIAVREFIKQNLPPGAKLHFAGHSQGGIVANNLADNQDFLDSYTVASVTTFGSPASANAHKDTDYKRFRTKGDLVPFLDRSILSVSAVGLLATGGHLTNQVRVDTDADFLIGAHSAYGTASLEDYGDDMPFEISDEYCNDPVTFSLNTSDELMTDDTSDIGQSYQIGASLVLSTYDTWFDSQTLFLPDSIRTEIDRYSDRFYEVAINDVPIVIDAVVDTGTQIVDGATDLVGEAASATGEFFGNLFSI